MSTVLAEILAAKRRRLLLGEFQPAGAARAPSDGSRFLAALSGEGPRILAEIKHRSPSAGLILPEAGTRVEAVARAYRRGGAVALSVVIEQDFFGGDPSWLVRAKAASSLPALMKDFIVDERQLDFAISIGADAVLLIVAALPDGELSRLHRAAKERGLAVLVEAHDAGEIERARGLEPELVGVNARNLLDFSVDLPAMASLGASLPKGVVKVAESGIRTRDHVTSLSAAGYGAFLVGESLLRSPDPARGVRELRGEATTEVKICGLTREEDLDACAALGVDFAGLNFSPRSTRRVDLARGRALRERTSSFRGVVAVFAGNEPREIREVVESVRPDVLQLTDPPEAAADAWGKPVWQTVRVGRDDLSLASRWPGEALLYDTAVGGVSGGTGQTFDWALMDRVPRDRPVYLAGGLKPENVAAAIRRVRPDGVDVASGVESAPGIKDHARLAAFTREVRRNGVAVG